MEYESTQAKKLVKLLETSEAQEKAYWAKRLKRAILIWSLVFVLLVLSTVFIILGTSSNSKFVEFTLYYLKKGTDGEADILESEDRMAGNHDTIAVITPPKNIEGYDFTGKYYNNSNYEGNPIDPNSNIKNSLTFENALYTQYTLSHYKLSIIDDEVEGGKFETDEKAVGYNKKMYIVPSTPHYADDEEIANFLEKRKRYQAGETPIYVGSDFYYLYALKFSDVENNILRDFDGKKNKHISGFHYTSKEGSIIKFVFNEVSVKVAENNYQKTYIVYKYVNGEQVACNYSLQIKKDNVIEQYKPLVDQDGNLKTEIKSGVVYYLLGDRLTKDDIDANEFRMPARDTAITIDWEEDKRYVIVMDTIDDYSWNELYGNKDVVKVKDEYNLVYDTVADYVSDAVNDGVTNDWESLYKTYAEYFGDPTNGSPEEVMQAKNNWSKGIVFAEDHAEDGAGLNGAQVLQYLRNYFATTPDTLTINSETGNHKYPFSKYGYTVNRWDTAWEIYTKGDDGNWSWQKVDNTTSITSDKHPAVCILIRPAWTVVKYTAKFEANDASVKSDIGNVPGYDMSELKLTLGVDTVLNNKGKECTRRLIGTDTNFMNITRAGYEFVGWQINGAIKLRYNYMVGGNDKGHEDINTYPGKNYTKNHIIVENPTFDYKPYPETSNTLIKVTSNDFLNYNNYENKSIKNENRCFWKCEKIELGESFVFYYFGEYSDLINNKKSDLAVPLGYYTANSEGKPETYEIGLQACWNLIEYDITIDFGDLADNEIDLDSTNEFFAGYGHVYGKNKFNDFIAKTENNKTYLQRNYDALKTFNIPGKNDLYRRGHTLTGYKVYNGSEELDEITFGETQVNILINGEEDGLKSDTILIKDLSGDVKFVAQWKAADYTVNYATDKVAGKNEGGSGSWFELSTVTNYNSQSNKTKQSAYTHNSWLKNTVADTTFVADNIFEYGSGSAKVYVQLTQNFSNSTFRLNIGYDKEWFEIGKSELFNSENNEFTRYEKEFGQKTYGNITVYDGKVVIGTETINKKRYYYLEFTKLAGDVSFYIDQIDYNLVTNTFATHEDGYSALNAIETRDFNPSNWYLIKSDTDLSAIYNYNRENDKKINFVIVRNCGDLSQYFIYDMLNIKSTLNTISLQTIDACFTKVATIDFAPGTYDEVEEYKNGDNLSNIIYEKIANKSSEMQTIGVDENNIYTIKTGSNTVAIKFENNYEKVFKTWLGDSSKLLIEGNSLKYTGESGYTYKFDYNNINEPDTKYTLSINDIKIDTVTVNFGELLSADSDVLTGSDALKYDILDSEDTQNIINDVNKDIYPLGYKNNDTENAYQTAELTFAQNSTFVFKPIFSGKYNQFNDLDAEGKKNLLNGLFTSLVFEDEGKNADFIVDGKEVYIKVFVNKLTLDRPNNDVDIYLNPDAVRHIINHYNLTFNPYVTGFTVATESIDTGWGTIEDYSNNEDGYTKIDDMEKVSPETTEKELSFDYKYRFKLTLNAKYDNSEVVLVVNGSEIAKGNTYTSTDKIINVTFVFDDTNKWYTITITGVDEDLSIGFKNIYRNTNTLTITGYTDLAGTLDNISESLIPGEDRYINGTFMYRASFTNVLVYDEVRNTIKFNDTIGKFNNITTTYSTAGDINTFIANNFEYLAQLTDISDDPTKNDYAIFTKPIVMLIKTSTGTFTYITSGEYSFDLTTNEKAFDDSSEITGLTTTTGTAQTSYLDNDEKIELTNTPYTVTVTGNQNYSFNIKPKTFENVKVTLPDNYNKNTEAVEPKVYIIDYENYIKESDQDYSTIDTLGQTLLQNQNIAYQSYAILKLIANDGYNKNLTWSIKAGETILASGSGDGTEFTTPTENNFILKSDISNSECYVVVLLTGDTSNLEITVTNPVNTYNTYLGIGTSNEFTGNVEEDAYILELLDTDTNNDQILDSFSGSFNSTVNYGDELKIRFTLRPGYTDYTGDILSILYPDNNNSEIFVFKRSGANITLINSSSSNINISELPQVSSTIDVSTLVENNEKIVYFEFTISAIDCDFAFNISNINKNQLDVELGTNDNLTPDANASIKTENKQDINPSDNILNDNNLSATNSTYYGDNVQLTYTVNAGYELSKYTVTLTAANGGTYSHEFSVKAYVDSERNKHENTNPVSVKNTNVVDDPLLLLFNSITIVESVEVEDGVVTTTLTITIIRLAQSITVDITDKTVNTYTVSGSGNLDGGDDWSVNETFNYGADGSFDISIPVGYDKTTMEFTLTFDAFKEGVNEPLETIVWEWAVDDSKFKSTTNPSDITDLDYYGEIEYSISTSPEGNNNKFTFNINPIKANITVSLGVELHQYNVGVEYKNEFINSLNAKNNSSEDLITFVDSTITTETSKSTVTVEDGFTTVMYLTLQEYAVLDLTQVKNLNPDNIMNNENFNNIDYIINNINSLGFSSGSIYLLYNSANSLTKLYGFVENNDYFAIVFYKVASETTKIVDLKDALSEKTYTLTVNGVAESDQNYYINADSLTDDEDEDVTTYTLSCTYRNLATAKEIYLKVNEKYNKTTPAISTEGVGITAVWNNGIITITWEEKKYNDVTVTLSNFKVNRYKLTLSETGNDKNFVSLELASATKPNGKYIYTLKAKYNNTNATQGNGTELYTIAITGNLYENAEVTTPFSDNTLLTYLSSGVYYEYDDLTIAVSDRDTLILNSVNSADINISQAPNTDKEISLNTVINQFSVTVSSANARIDDEEISEKSKLYGETSSVTYKLDNKYFDVYTDNTTVSGWYVLKSGFVTITNDGDIDVSGIYFATTGISNDETETTTFKMINADGDYTILHTANFEITFNDTSLQVAKYEYSMDYIGLYTGLNNYEFNYDNTATSSFTSLIYANEATYSIKIDLSSFKAVVTIKVEFANSIVDFTNGYLKAENKFGGSIDLPYGTSVKVELTFDTTALDKDSIKFTSSTKYVKESDFIYTISEIEEASSNSLKFSASLKQYIITLPDKLGVSEIADGSAYNTDKTEITDIADTLKADGEQTFVVEYGTTVTLAYKNTSNMDYAEIDGSISNSKLLANDLIYYNTDKYIGGEFNTGNETRTYGFNVVAQDTATFTFGVNYIPMRYYLEYTNNLEGINSITVSINNEYAEKMFVYTGFDRSENATEESFVTKYEEIYSYDNTQDNNTQRKIWFSLLNEDGNTEYVPTVTYKIEREDEYSQNGYTLTVNGIASSVTDETKEATGVVFKDDNDNGKKRVVISVEMGNINNYTVTLQNTNGSLEFEDTGNTELSNENKNAKYNNDHGETGTFMFKFSSSYSQAELFTIANADDTDEYYTFDIDKTENTVSIKNKGVVAVTNNQLTFDGKTITLVSVVYNYNETGKTGEVTITWQLNDVFNNNLTVSTDDIDGYTVSVQNSVAQETFNIGGEDCDTVREGEQRRDDSEVIVTITVKDEYTRLTDATLTFEYGGTPYTYKPSYDSTTEKWSWSATSAGIGGLSINYEKVLNTETNVYEDIITITFNIKADMDIKFESGVNIYNVTVEIDESIDTEYGTGTCFSVNKEDTDGNEKLGNSGDKVTVTINVSEKYNQLNNGELTFNYGGTSYTYTPSYDSTTEKWSWSATSAGIGGLSINYEKVLDTEINAYKDIITITFSIEADMTIKFTCSVNQYSVTVNYIDLIDSNEDSIVDSYAVIELKDTQAIIIDHVDTTPANYTGGEVEEIISGKISNFEAPPGLKFIGFVTALNDDDNDGVDENYSANLTNILIGGDTYVKDNGSSFTLVDKVIDNITVYAVYTRATIEAIITYGNAQNNTPQNLSITFGSDIVVSSVQKSKNAFEYVSDFCVGTGGIATGMFVVDNSSGNLNLTIENTEEAKETYLQFIINLSKNSNKLSAVYKYIKLKINFVGSSADVDLTNLKITDIFDGDNSNKGWLYKNDASDETYKFINTDGTYAVKYDAYTFSSYGLAIDGSQNLINANCTLDQYNALMLTNADKDNDGDIDEDDVKLYIESLNIQTTYLSNNWLSELIVKDDEIIEIDNVAYQFSGLKINNTQYKSNGTNLCKLKDIVDAQWNSVATFNVSEYLLTFTIVAEDTIAVDYLVDVVGTEYNIGEYFGETLKSAKDIIAEEKDGKYVVDGKLGHVKSTDASGNPTEYYDYEILTSLYKIEGVGHYGDGYSGGYATFVPCYVYYKNAPNIAVAITDVDAWEDEYYDETNKLSIDKLKDSNIVRVAFKLEGLRGSDEKAPLLISSAGTWNTILQNMSKQPFDADGNPIANPITYYFAQTADLSDYNTGCSNSKYTQLEYKFYGHYKGVKVDEDNNAVLDENNNIVNTTITRNGSIRPIFGHIVNGSVDNINVVGNVADVTTGWSSTDNTWGNVAVEVDSNVTLSNITLGSTGNTVTVNSTNLTNIGTLVGKLNVTDVMDNPSTSEDEGDKITIKNITNNYKVTGSSSTEIISMIANVTGNTSIVEITNVTNNGAFSGAKTAAGVIYASAGTVNLLGTSTTPIKNTGEISAINYAYGVAYIANATTVEYLTNTGNVTANSNNAYGVVSIDTATTVQNLTNTGNVTANSNNAYGVALIESANTVTDMENTGEVTAKMVYGVVDIEDVVLNGVDDIVTITGLTNSGTLTATGTATGEGNVYGVAEITLSDVASEYNINNCTNTGSIKATGDVYGVINITGSVGTDVIKINAINNGESETSATIGTDTNPIGGEVVGAVNIGNSITTGNITVYDCHNYMNMVATNFITGVVKSTVTATATATVNVGDSSTEDSLTNSGNIESKNHSAYGVVNISKANNVYNLTNNGTVKGGVSSIATVGVARIDSANEVKTLLNTGNVQKTCDSAMLCGVAYINNTNIVDNLTNNGEIGVDEVGGNSIGVAYIISTQTITNLTNEGFVKNAQGAYGVAIIKLTDKNTSEKEEYKIENCKNLAGIRSKVSVIGVLKISGSVGDTDVIEINNINNGASGTSATITGIDTNNDSIIDDYPNEVVGAVKIDNSIITGNITVYDCHNYMDIYADGEVVGVVKSGATGDTTNVYINVDSSGNPLTDASDNEYYISNYGKIYKSGTAYGVACIGKVTKVENLTNFGDITAESDVYGVAYIETLDATNGLINNLTNNGRIVSNNAIHIAGVVGVGSNIKSISNCFNLNHITNNNSSAKSVISGVVYTTGVIDSIENCTNGLDSGNLLNIQVYKAVEAGTIDEKVDYINDEVLDINDVVLLFRYSMMPGYPIGDIVDINGDSVIDDNDKVDGEYTYDQSNYLLDLNNDGLINIDDSVLLVYFINGAVTSLPYSNKVNLEITSSYAGDIIAGVVYAKSIKQADGVANYADITTADGEGISGTSGTYKPDDATDATGYPVHGSVVSGVFILASQDMNTVTPFENITNKGNIGSEDRKPAILAGLIVVMDAHDGSGTSGLTYIDDALINEDACENTGTLYPGSEEESMGKYYFDDTILNFNDAGIVITTKV